MDCLARITRALLRVGSLAALSLLLRSAEIACQPPSGDSTATHTWGFVSARVDSRFSEYVYTGYGYDAAFVVGGLVINPHSGYNEQVLGAGMRLPSYREFSQLAAITFCNASDARYIQAFYLPSLKLASVSAGAAMEVYLPIESAGVKQLAITGLSVTSRVAGPFSAGGVYELSAAEHTPTSHGAGVTVRVALPGAELSIDGLHGIAHQKDHARLGFRAFY